jgi:hypothetical protein
MRIAQKIALAVAIAALVVLASSCTSPVSPTVTRPPMTSLNAHPAIYLQANVQRQRILDSLRGAGIRTAQSLEEADYILAVDVGKRRVNMKCGGMHNIVYTLSGKGFPLMEIKGRGLTGDCTPNAFDEMSQTLVSYFGG